jgi:putative ABC transport system substrate-binding protein
LTGFDENNKELKHAASKFFTKFIACVKEWLVDQEPSSLLRFSSESAVAIDPTRKFVAPVNLLQFSSSDPVPTPHTTIPRCAMVCAAWRAPKALGDGYMRRRDFITLLGGTAATGLALGLWSPALHAQSRMHRVGVLFPADDTPGVRTLIEAIAGLGYVEGRNIAYDIRAAGRQVERLPQLARELVARHPDVIVSASEHAARALIDATRDIPIVLALIGDPVRLGLTNSIARRSGNVTGFTTGIDTVAAKRLELLSDMVPTAGKVALLWVPTNAQHRLVVERTRQAAARLKVELLSLPVTTAADISLTIAKAEYERAAALLVTTDPLTVRNSRTIIDESLLRNLPAMHNYAFEVKDGALMSYGSDVGEDHGRTADYIDRILKGAKVADLLFQEPTKYRHVINLKTAKDLGLSVPPSLLARADEVIE